MVCSVTEGEDKPLKYPLMFRACELVVVNKIDLLPHLDFDLERLARQPRRGQPRGATMLVSSARTGEGVDEWREWLARRARARARRPLSGGEAPMTTGDRRTRSRPRRRAARRTAPRPTALLRGARPSALARCCHRMAERFARGGRLVALGRSPAARSDARHVAVEFVHPVIVGKRALPAIGLAPEGGPLPAPARRGRRSRTTSRSPSAATSRRRRDARRRSRRAASRGLPDDRLRARPAPSGSSSPRARPVRRQELVETLYHVLWELVHVFFDHRGLLEGREARAGPRHRRLELPLSVPRRGRARPRRGGRRRAPLGPAEGGRGRRRCASRR